MNCNRKYLLVVALLAAGCGGGGGGYDGGGGGNNNPPVTTPPPPAPTGTAFTSFIKTQLAQTSDTSEPADVNDRQFEFEDTETAFDDVLN